MLADSGRLPWFGQGPRRDRRGALGCCFALSSWPSPCSARLDTCAPPGGVLGILPAAQPHSCPKPLDHRSPLLQCIYERQPFRPVPYLGGRGPFQVAEAGVGAALKLPWVGQARSGLLAAGWPRSTGWRSSSRGSPAGPGSSQDRERIPRRNSGLMSQKARPAMNQSAGRSILRWTKIRSIWHAHRMERMASSTKKSNRRWVGSHIPPRGFEPLSPP